MSDPTCRRLSGDVCVVTGAGGGVGREIANRLASEGARVALVDGDYASGTAAEERINDADHPGEAKFVRADVTDEAAIKGVLHAVADEWDGIDGVVTTAGIDHRDVADKDATETGEDATGAGEDATETGENATETGENATETGENATETGERDPSVLATSEVEWDLTFARTLKSVFFCTKHAAPIVADGGGGAIVAVAPDSADGNADESVASAAATSGVAGFVRRVATELASRDVRVNAVSRAGERNGGDTAGDDAAGVAHDSFAAAAAYLLSEDAVGVTGIELPVRGEVGPPT